MSDDSPTTKKRKANDGRATVPDGGGGGFLPSLFGYFSGRRDATMPTTCGGENLTQKMDAMMQMMSRMEEKLTTVSSLERRCENLEAKCSKLENALGDMKEHIGSKIDRQHEYNNMLVRNQSWKYPAQLHTQGYWMNDGHDDDVASYLSDSSECLKDLTEKLRQGEFPPQIFPQCLLNNNERGINLNWDGEDPILDRAARSIMLPHWRAFISALKQLNPAFGVVPDGCETFFTLETSNLLAMLRGC